MYINKLERYIATIRCTLKKYFILMNGMDYVFFML